MIPQHIAEKHSGRFEYGVSDCVQFVADMIEVTTGKRPALPDYSSDRSVLQLLAEADLTERCRWTFGDPIPLADAEPGDIVVSSFAEFGQIVGVAEPPVFWIRSDNGPIPVDMSLAVRVFRCRKPQSLS